MGLLDQYSTQREHEMHGRSEFGSGARSEFASGEGEHAMGRVQHHTGNVPTMRIEGFEHLLHIVEHLVKTQARSDMLLELPLSPANVTVAASTDEEAAVMAANCQNPMVPERLFLQAVFPNQWQVTDIKVGSKSQFTVAPNPGIVAPPAAPFTRWANVTVGGRNQFTEMEIGSVFSVFLIFTGVTGQLQDTGVGSVSGPAKDVTYSR